MIDRTVADKKLIFTVLLCHFLTSFTALGMPVFYPVMLNGLLESKQQHWIGLYYSLPLICMALSAPLWGHFADRYGKRLSLMRAQAGLVIAFLMTGFATDLYQFTIGILLQGLFGGTFAASNAYLAYLVRSSELVKTQNWMQVSARLSLLLAPMVLGAFIGMTHPRQLFIYLSLLPFIALVITSRMPHATVPIDPQPNETKSCPDSSVAPSRLQVSVIQFCFYFSTTVTFPYFLPWVQSLQVSSTQAIGFLFSLPHLCYLAFMLAPIPTIKRADGLVLCQFAFVIFMIASWQQASMTSIDGLIFWRLLTGIALFLGFLGVHKLIGALTNAGNAGRQFGWFDAIGKWSAVAAGLASGVTINRFGLSSFFYLSVFTLFIAWLMVCYGQVHRALITRQQGNVVHSE